MTLMKNILYGFISGITEFLPVSSRGHQALMRYILGTETSNPILDLMVHIGVIIALFVCCRETIRRLLREQRSTVRSRRKRNRSLDSRSLYDLRLLKTAAFPLTVGLLLSVTTKEWGSNLLVLVGFFALNAIFLLLAEHTWRGNRDSRTMTGLDGIIMGIAGAASAFPGISRTGMISAYAIARGADTQNSANWATLLGIPALLFAVGFDIFSLISFGVSAITFSAIAAAFAAGLAGFCGGYIGISLFLAVMNHSGFSPFAYYSFGAALFSFALYLIT